MISVYGPAPLKRERKKANQVMLNSCHLQALAEDLSTDSHKFLRFSIGYFMCVKQKTDLGDPLEDKIHTKITFTSIYV